MTRHTLAVLALALGLAGSTEAQTVTIRATDATTGADVQRVGDDTNDALRVTVVSPSTLTVAGTVTANQGGAWSVAQSGSWLVQGLVAHGATYSGNPLPTGCYGSASAPTAVTDGQIARLWCLTNGALAVQLQNASLAVTAASLPLPTGAATSAAQTTGNASLSSIDGKIPALVSGRVPVDGSGVVQPASQSGTWSVRNQDGAGNALTSATRGSERALSVQIVDGSGAQVTSFGGGGSGATIGSAVPSTGSYGGINVAGTLRGWTGLALGSQYAGTVAIVDGSGNQVTSFGGSGGTASNVGSAVPSTATATGYSDGTNMQVPRVFDGDTGAGAQYVAGVVLRASGSGGTVEAGTASNPLHVSLANTGANATAVKVDGSAVTQPVSISGNQAVNLTQLAGNSVSAGNGASGTGVQRVTIANDSTGVVGLNAGSNLVGYVGLKPTYAAKATITWTGTSLGNGSARESTVIDWTSTKCADARIRIQSKGQTGGTNYVDWYVYTALGDTTYTDGATGSDAAIANRFNSRYLGSQKMNAGTTATQVELQLSDIFGAMPDKWGLIGINNSGAALSSTAGDHVLEYQCVN